VYRDIHNHNKIGPVVSEMSKADFYFCNNTYFWRWADMLDTISKENQPRTLLAKFGLNNVPVVLQEMQKW